MITEDQILDVVCTGIQCGEDAKEIFMRLDNEFGLEELENENWEGDDLARLINEELHYRHAEAQFDMERD